MESANLNATCRESRLLPRNPLFAFELRFEFRRSFVPGFRVTRGVGIKLGRDIHRLASRSVGFASEFPRLPLVSGLAVRLLRSSLDSLVASHELDGSWCTLLSP